jgi:carbon catabolite-derepressing protein kinase
MAPAFDEEELAITFTSSSRRNVREEEHQAPPSQQQPAQQPSRSQTERRAREPQYIGPYRVIKTLGQGSFGKVKLAVHRTTGQNVALKMISRKELVNRDMVGRVDREIQYLQLLRHPHIIKL